MLKDRAYYDALTEQVIGCAYAVGRELGCGFLEKVYENALRIELEREGLRAEQQHPVQVCYRGQVVGDFVADLLVDGDLIVELKAVKQLEDVHLAQCLNYLKATGRPVGLLINFGQSKVQIRRVVNRFPD
ncbi:GxxExxY protein [Geothermobacter ehrlichii]|uniref:GxxExxY protein n=1 Tax=Geothermobacter ehrlichii TaxID=213224 RepID=A0A5D3WM29_9BACT|nr:GxxExxY protein [Geothermobacter ehrlichii]TYO98342.1 GxxExxY protein [Geothermobacter ehrlichii]